MNLDKLLYALNVLRDNHGGSTPVFFSKKSINSARPTAIHDGVIGSFTAIELSQKQHPDLNPNHDVLIDARSADDLRKLDRAVAHFRQAVAEFGRDRYARHDPNDPDKFKRLVKQMEETAMDVRHTMGHIWPKCGGR